MKLKDETVLIIGMMSFVFGIIIEHFINIEYAGFWISDFVEGVLYGFSLVMNLFYLMKKSIRLSTKI